MPEPATSIQPVRPQSEQPSPSQTKQETATPSEGSVNGKKSVESLIRRSSPKSARIIASSVPFRSASVIPSSTARPSTWWKYGMCVASAVSRR